MGGIVGGGGGGNHGTGTVWEMDGHEGWGIDSALGWE